MRTWDALQVPLYLNTALKPHTKTEKMYQSINGPLRVPEPKHVLACYIVAAVISRPPKPTPVDYNRS